jgi:hypothetical protein
MVLPLTVANGTTEFWITGIFEVSRSLGQLRRVSTRDENSKFARGIEWVTSSTSFVIAMVEFGI